MIMRKKSTQLTIGNMVSYISRCFLLMVCCLPAGEIFAQNIFSGEPVQWVGRPNSYLTVPYNSDYRTTAYRRISVNSGSPTDGRGQWSTTIFASTSGGNIGLDNMPGGGGAGWLMISGPLSNRFQNKWNFNGVGQAAVNAINDITLQSGGQDMGLNMGVAGYYTFNMRDNGYSSSQVFIGFTSAAPVTVTRTGQSFNPINYSSNISISTSASPTANETVYIRYKVGSSDFSSGTSIVQATGSGTSWTAAIPQQTCGVTVYYYVFTSTRSISQLNGDSEQNRSLAAIRYDDNSGNNYSYVVSPAPTAAITNNSATTVLNCITTSISVTASGGVAYSWTGGLGNSASASITAPGTYTVTATADNGCTDDESIVITQDITPPTAGITNNSGTTVLTCTQTSINVTATGGVSYEWDNELGTDAEVEITAPGTYTVTVTGANGCTSTADITVTQDVTAPPAGITNNTGTTVLTCVVTSISVTATGGSSYAWDGGLGNSASASITAPGTYTVTVTGANGCTDVASIVITQNLVLPGTPAPVQGISNVCPYIGTPTQLTYTVPQDPNVGSYNWIVPPTVTIVSGQGTNSINVTINNGFVANANKLVRVTGSSTCGTSGERLFYMLAQLPTTPAPIVASSTDICAVIGTPGTITYTIPKVAAATSYIWSAQSGTTTIVHPNGTGVNDTTVTVSFAGGFTTSAITVVAVNDCGTSGTRSFTIVKNNPSTPGLISGPTNACAFIAPGGTSASYSVTPVAGATGYTWTVPAGAIGLTGQGTNSISFTYPSGFTSGTVSVVASNGCGTSGIRTLSITKLNPATPGGIDVIQLQPCPERVYSYTVAAIPANATSIQWTASAGTILTGQGTTSITVSYPGTIINGTVTATAVSNCGNSLARTINVKLPACVLIGREAGSNTAKGNASVNQESLNVNIFPNPTSSDFKLQVITTGSESAKVRVMDLQGRTLNQITVKPYQTINLGASLKAGSYIVEVKQGNQVKSTRVIKF